VLTAARNAAAREAMEEAGLTVDPEALVWFAHWTPGAIGATRRFATWFFVGRAPEGQVVVDDGEIREHQWIRPADALTRRESGEIELIPPTWVTLHKLAEASSTAEVCAAARARDPEIFLTHIVRVDGGIASLWAGDAGYDDHDPDKPGPRNRLLMLDTGWRLETSF
jgi:ADP-ribose pyrophosphatase YjhB (NUDIX family)